MAAPFPKPLELRVLEGNPGKRKINRFPPKFGSKAPKCPGWLDDLARAEWARIGPRLEAIGLLTDGDLAVFASYCKAYSDLQHAQEVVKTEGYFTTANNGALIAHPAQNIANQAMKKILETAIQFGFTPSARSRIDLKPSDGDGGEDLD